MHNLNPKKITLILITLTLCLFLAGASWAHDPDFTQDFNREGCTFATTGNNPYWPMWPGYSQTLQGEEDDEGETVEIEQVINILPETEMVDGVLTRVLEEVESEDGELVEISRNFIALCRETGDVWYFGEDVDDYEDGEIIGHEGAWRAGVDGAVPGVLMPGSPMIGARFYNELFLGEAEDQAEIVSMDDALTVPYGSFTGLLKTNETSPLDPGDVSEKWYAAGIGIIKDEDLELTSITLPPCLPDATTHCLQNGRFKVEAEWEDFEGNEGDGTAILPSGDSGEFWFFGPANTELVVKVLDACALPQFNHFWVFAAGLSNVEVTLTVTDTQSLQFREYENDLGTDFAPILDTTAFATCP